MQHEHEHSAWKLLDAVIYLAAGLAVGMLAAVIIGRGQLPIVVPDSPASLIEATDH